MSADQKRYQVFVSSTYLDLREARQAVTSALLECDAFPAGMELFPAADDDAWTLIKKVIDESDYYLLIIGGKYGSVDVSEGISYTEKEFDYAQVSSKPVMAFLHGDPDSLAVSASETEREPRDKLEAFRMKVKTAKHVKYWISAEQLAGQVALTYNKFTRLYPGIGWIRANHATSTESLQALADAHAQVAALRDELKQITTSAPPGTEHLAQGSDEVIIEIGANARFVNSKGSSSHLSRWVSGTTTWDSLFAGIAPRLLQECEEDSLKKALTDALSLQFYDEIIAGIVAEASDQGASLEESDIRDLSITIDDDDFGGILVQFTAIGLISRSEKKRSVSDGGTYWALTPFGRTHTIKLRAMKRGGRTKLAVPFPSSLDETAVPASEHDPL